MLFAIFHGTKDTFVLLHLRSNGSTIVKSDSANKFGIWAAVETPTTS